MPTRYSLFLLALAVWCVLGTVARAQDRIVTMEGEQISCRVLLQDSLSVVYMLHHKGAKSEVMPRYRVYRVDINLPEEMHWVKRHLPPARGCASCILLGTVLGSISIARHSNHLTP